MLALAACLALSLLAFSRVRVESDLASLLPTGTTPAARLMMQQIQTGAASRLVLIGLEGADAPALAQASDGMAHDLTASHQFSFVSNGRSVLDEATQQAVFRARYLLAPSLSPETFYTTALRQDFSRLLDALASSATPLVQQYGLPDPTGAFLSLPGIAAGSQHAALREGVWFAPERNRALLLARMSGNGSALAAQDAAIAAIGAAFAKARATTPGLRLLTSGPAVFARDAAHAIRADVERLSILSTLLVIALLIWRFRSLWVVAAIAVPLSLGVAAAALAVQIGFGFLHGITLGFGMTMLGVTVDYPVLLIGHRKPGEAPAATWARIGQAFTLAVATALLGLSGMAFAGFPGLAQLGLFSLTGVLTAALATRFLLPRLITAADLAPVWAGSPRRLSRLEALRRYRLWALLPVAAAALFLLLHPPRWQPSLAALSPVPAALQALDQQLRRELGAPDIGQVLAVQGSDAEGVLQREESLRPLLARLAANGVILGHEDAATFLPSIATQRARQAMLPDAATLAARIAAAQTGLPFAATAFDAFKTDVAAARTMTPIEPGTIHNPALATRLQTMLMPQGDGWLGLVTLRGVTSAAALAEAVAGLPQVTLVDVGGEMNGLVAGYTRQALPWIAGGAVAALLVLAIGLRDARRVLRVAGVIAASLLVTLALLTVFGTRISLIHLVALQFVAGVGLDYALFFARTGLDAEERSRTFRTLLTCNAMALLTFGLLCTCQTPLLRMIGETVAIGVLASMLLAFFLAAPAGSGVVSDEGF